MPSEPNDPPITPSTGAKPGIGWLAWRAQRAAQVLKDEYEAGKRGDHSPAATIWATPREQLDALLTLLHGSHGDDPSGSVAAGDSEQVAGALRGVDWSGVRAATADRSGEAARAARAMAEQVDWARVQPAAQRVSKALIAAVASGQIGVVGPFGSLIARAIVDQGGLARQVGGVLDGEHAMLPTDVDAIIETTAREVGVERDRP